MRAAGGVRVERAITDLLVASAFPNVVAACVKRAQTLAGIADRQLLVEHMSATSMNMALEEAAQKARQRQGIMERHLAPLLEDRIDGDH